MNIKAIITCAALVLSCPCGPHGTAIAKDYPTKPIRIIVPAGPGGPTDVPARLASQILTAKFGQPVVVENKPGAGGVIGSREVAAARPDGYTLLSGGTAVFAVIPAMSGSAGYEPTRDFVPVAKVMDAFQVLVVAPSSPWKSVKELVADAKAHPGKFNFSHIGTAHITHLAGELFTSHTGTKIVGVPYRSGPESLTAVLSGAVQMTFENIAIVLPLIRDGKLRALAVTSRTRAELMPELPTMIEAGVDNYEVTSFFGIVAPVGTPDTIVRKLNATINEALTGGETRAMITRLGGVPTPESPAEFGKFIAEQETKWKAVGKTAGIEIK
jgi:tripartite-type tricarboxylate transporter receptor subunit TctC